jgi:hypothetical protein
MSLNLLTEHLGALEMHQQDVSFRLILIQEHRRATCCYKQSADLLNFQVNLAEASDQVPSQKQQLLGPLE